MTRLRQIAMAGLAAIAIGGVANPAFATIAGSFENRLAGATIGLPLGAAPPPGIYTGLETAYLGMLSGSSNTGHANQAPGSPVLPAIAQAVPLLWVPGWNWFGATYSASVVQAFYIHDACGAPPNTSGGCGGASPFAAGGMVYANTFIQPINLSWKLGGGWFVAPAFSFTVPDGSRQGPPVAGAFGTPNPDYWTFEPSLAISYLGQNWVASANLFYDINTRSQGVCCAADATITPGNLFYGDFTAVYKIGKWSIGPVAYTEIQTTNDTGAGCAIPFNCARHTKSAAGGLLGYDFGPVDLQVWVTDNFEATNSADGVGALHVWTRLGFKIWGFEAPVMPLVSKN
jgi:hypothetical protein